jgi:hypothetical protein
MAEGPDGLYFTDFWGESVGIGNEPGKGSVWKIVPSEASLHLSPTGGDEHLTPVERGRKLAGVHCAQCHRLEGVGGFEGPELTNVVKTLGLRLHSPGYEATVKQLRTSDQTFFQEQRWRLDEVLQRNGEARIRCWLTHHLEEPRFDNALARMPSLRLLPEDDRSAVIEYLMTLKQ